MTFGHKALSEEWDRVARLYRVINCQSLQCVGKCIATDLRAAHSKQNTAVFFKTGACYLRGVPSMALGNCTQDFG